MFNLVYENVNNIYNFCFDDDRVAIVVGESDGEGQLHCGIIYKSNEKISILHLAWHNLLKNDKLNFNDFGEFFWVKSKINHTKQKMVAALCRRIIKRRDFKNIPYGLIYNGGHFLDNGLLYLQNEECGLTCATFILAVFQSVGYPLLEHNSWPPRAEDENWHEFIVETLENTSQWLNVTNVHIENVRGEIGCARFRPEEVGISSLLTPSPSDFHSTIPYSFVFKSIITNN